MTRSNPVTIPEGSYSDHLVFTGVIVAGDRKIDVRRIALELIKYEYPRELRFTCELATSLTEELNPFLRSAEPLEFRGRWESSNDATMIQKPAVRLLVRASSWSGTEIKGVAEMVDTDIAPLPKLPSSQEVSAELTPTDLAFESVEHLVRYPSGEEAPLHFEKPRPPFCVSVDSGKYELSLWRQREEVMVGGTRAKVAIPIVGMHRSVAEDQRTRNAADLLDQTQSHIQDVEHVLTFLSRRYVRCHTIRVWSSVPDEPHVQHAIRHLPSWSSAAPPERLVEPRILGSNDIDTVLDRFRTSDFKEPITHAINFLLAYWMSRFAENSVSAGFTAFETIVNGVSEKRGTTRTMSEEDFDDLSPILRSEIKKFATSRGMTSETRAAVYSKLGELARAPIAPRAAAILTEHDVVWQDLWDRASVASGAPLERLISAAYGRRSLLVHTGVVNGWAELLADAATVHALTERLICRMLGVPDNWLWHFAHYYAKR